ncbi:MAG: hypothetical protein P4M08_03195 [Oligoflexia bacterium]|nr:hypothetical protein [Oligoflexia bacterium]
MSQNVLFVQTKIQPPCFKGVKQALSQSKGLEMMEAANYAEALTVLQSGWGGLIMITTAEKDDLLPAVNFLAAQFKAIKKLKTVRVIVFNQLPGNKVQTVFTNLGASEILEFKVSGKAVLHKMQRHLKLLAVSNDDKDDDEDESGSGEATASEPQYSAQLVAALTHPADCWLTEPKPNAKRVMARWNIELTGPGPSAGQWVQAGNKSYEWKPNAPQGAFAFATGRWIFTGRIVQYFPRNRRWRFTGDRISLSFFEEGKAVAHRFFTESDGSIKIAENSQAAKDRLPLIEASLDEDGTISDRIGKKTRADGTEDADSGEEGDLSVHHLDGDSTEAREKKLKRLSNEPEAEEDKDFRYREALRESGDLVTNSADGPEPEWRDHNPASVDIYNEERGIVPKDEEFGTFDKAFLPARLNTTINELPAEILKSSERVLTVSLKKTDLKVGAEVSLDVVTENLPPDGKFNGRCKIINIAENSTPGSMQIEIEMNETSLKSWELIQNTIDSRQMNILRFFKMAKGA